MVTPETRMCGDKIVSHAGRNVKSAQRMAWAPTSVSRGRGVRGSGQSWSVYLNLFPERPCPVGCSRQSRRKDWAR